MKEPPASPQQPSSPRNLFFRRPRQKRNPLSRPYDDEVGVILTKLLNQSRTFSYNSSSKAQPDSEHTFVVPPFLSKHNGRILHCRINRWRQIPPSRLWASLKELLYATHAYLWQPQNQPSRRNVFLLTATVLFFLYCLGVALVHAVIAYGAQTICAVSSGFFVLLLDHDEAEKACPNAIKELAACFQRGVHSLDNFLQVHRFAGREWNKLDMEWDRASNAASTRTRLWDLPPPTIHTTGQRIDPEFSVRPEWGDATAHHHAAINFCYAMLREEQLSKASTSNRQQKKASQASSVILHEKVPLILSETPKRSKSSGLINERDWGSDSIAKNKRASRSVVTVMSTNLRQPFPELASIKSLIEEFEVKVGDRTTPKSQIADYADEPLNSCHVLEEDTLSELRSDVQSVGSDVAGDLPWIDVGAKIGMSLLNSAHLQRALVSREAKDCFMERLGREGGNASLSDMASSIAGAVSDTGSAGLDTNDIVKQPPKPTHSMWSSPAIVVADTGEESPLCSASSLCDVDPMYNFDDSAKEDLSSPTLSPTLSIPIDLLLQKPRSSIYPRPFFGRTSNATRSYAKHFSTGERSPSKESKGTKQFSPNLTNMHVKQMRGWFSGQEVPLPAGSDNYVRELDAPSCVGTVVVSSEDASNTTDRNRRRLPLQRGIKVAVPVFPNQPRAKGSEKRLSQANYQMGTVMCSERIFVGSLRASLERFTGETNCLSVTVQLDRSFLRNGEFAELTLRVLDSWTSRYMPRHSKVPLGSCVVSSFGIGVLAGWRAEDDCHVVRSLWQRRGSGAAHAYLNRSAIYGTIEAGIGFRVETRFGWGTTQAYVKVGRDFLSGSYLVKIGEEGRMKGHIIEIARPGILSCHGAQFIPVIEHLREAANFQIQVDNYNAAFRERCLDNTRQESDKSFWRSWSKCGELFWNSFLKAAEEDRGFDRGVNEFMSDLISFLDRLDINQTDPNLALDHCISNDFEVECVVRDENEPLVEEKKDTQEPGFWIINDILGGVFKRPDQESDRIVEDNESFELDAASANAQYHERAFGVIQTLMKTVSIARAASTEHPHFRLALAIGYDFLLFVRTLVKVQRKNMSGQSLMIWKRALNEIASTFGPITQRIERIGRGIAARMEKQGRKAKVRTLKFVDIILGDERLLFALEQGEWTQCATRLEIAFVKSQIIPEECVLHYRKMVRFLVNHIQTAMANNGGAAERNNEKIVLLAQIVQWIAAPRRSVLKFFRDDNVLELFERILVRVFRKEELASRMLMIHASNFQSLRHFRMLKDFSTSGRLWIPLLDAADEEFSWMAAHVPESAKGFMCSLSNLFSLCVAQFHRINAGDLSMDWLDFLLEDDAVRIVHDIDIKLILALEAFSRDVKEMMAIVPYYASIDDDILNLMDEVDVDEFLKEGVEAMEDPEKLSQFIREKSTIAIERFLNYLPKMSIPVEKRELGEGWMLTCHGKDGGDLTLSDVKIRRKNLICQVIGGDSLFFPMFGDDDVDDASVSVPDDINPLFSPSGCIEESILDHIRGILLEAQRQGCWQAGFGGVEKPPTDRYVAAVLHNLPISSVLNCAIELWRNLEIDDDELLEIAVRDVSYQIELHQERKDETNKERSKKSCADISRHEECLRCPNPLKTPSFDTVRRRFNPRLDPTVLYLEMNKLSLKLDKFLFLIEKKARNIFDPLFEGQGTLCIQNISIKLRVECGKERTRSHGLGIDEMSPILLLKDLEVSLDRVQLKVQDTGFGSDWILNKAVHVFEANITRVVADNLRDQIEEQAKNAIENLNSYFLVNPNMLLNILDVTMDDLDERVVFV